MSAAVGAGPPDVFAPDVFAPDVLAPDVLAPEVFAPDVCAPDVCAPVRDAPLDIPRIVGPAAWSALPACLRRRFEPGHGPAVYRGEMRLERSLAGLVFARASAVFGGPLPARRADRIEAVVAVRAQAGGVVWERRIGARVIRSVKQPGPGGTLLERTGGGLGMVLDVSVEGGALVFVSRSFFLSVGRLRVPIPALLTPGRCRVAHEAVDEARFRFTLAMTHPLWGTTFRQSGVFTDPPHSTGFREQSR